MVHAVEIALSHYLSIPYQDFTEKVIAAKGVLTCLDTKDAIVAIERINYLLDITSKSIYISLFDLDRWVNPKSTVDEKMTFSVHDDCLDNNFLRNGRLLSKRNGDDYFAQRCLCQAVDEVNQLVFENITVFSKDFPIKGEMSI